MEEEESLNKEKPTRMDEEGKEGEDEVNDEDVKDFLAQFASGETAEERRAKLETLIAAHKSDDEKTQRGQQLWAKIENEARAHSA